jgi:hypothetical protein
VQSTPAGPELAQLAAGGLSPIEKVLALQRVPLFGKTTVEEMLQLAAITSTVPMTAGQVLFSESAPAALWMILSGEVTLGGGSTPSMRTRAGDIIGSLHTLGGEPVGLFEVLGERPELLRQMFAAMFRRVADPAFASGVFRPRVATASSVG